MAEKHVRLKQDTKRLLDLTKAELLKNKPTHIDRVTDDVTIKEALQTFLQNKQVTN